ncbi:hypothetical protein CDL12_20714 [Handroanthus impetiginosus]|uniref:Uncharacterized protein n=1 Tax=Handroanthus impetiginosus TaxID=429701 RepID=A0A2G9GN53_9LAMI|nr:hypothetical protein CDL12_20714 [Handroanthus impetiginosus]
MNDSPFWLLWQVNYKISHNHPTHSWQTCPKVRLISYNLCLRNQPNQESKPKTVSIMALHGGKWATYYNLTYIPSALYFDSSITKLLPPTQNQSRFLFCC